MKALRLYRYLDTQSFVYDDAPCPTPGEGEVLVKVHAAAVTPTELDWLPNRTARDGTPRPLPIILGHEFSGVIESLGPGVTTLAPGAEVFGMNDWYIDGAQADYCIARADDVAAKPQSVDHILAAATPISALTAWQGLIERARLAPGEHILIHGAAGGVGIFATQLAHWRGARITATVSPRNIEFVRTLGAKQIIDYRTQPFEDIVEKVDVVFDTVGGDTLARSIKVLKSEGRLVTVAASSAELQDQRARDAFFIVEPNRADLARIAKMIDQGDLRILVDRVFALAEGRDAYEHNTSRGKVALIANHEEGRVA